MHTTSFCSLKCTCAIWLELFCCPKITAFSNSLNVDCLALMVQLSDVFECLFMLESKTRARSVEDLAFLSWNEKRGQKGSGYVVVFDGEKHSHMHRLALVCVSKVLLHWMWKHCDRFSWEYADFSSLEKLINAVSAHTWPAVLTLFWLNVLCACDSMHLSACVTSSRSICGSAPLHQTWYSGNRSLSMYSSCTWARYVMQLTVFVAAYVCMW